MPFTLAKVAQDPQLLTTRVVTASGEAFLIRPLVRVDAPKLAVFLSELSLETRYFSTFSGYDTKAAQELCDAIARYDKLRFVVEAPLSQQIIGLLEFSFSIPESDVTRYATYNMPLDPASDCRFGPTFADLYQNRGIGTAVFPFVVEVARKFGRNRILLWGGVVSDNFRAIRYYEKNGFHLAGAFTPEGGVEAMDMFLDI